MAPSWITSSIGQTTVTCRTTNKSSDEQHIYRSFFLPEQDLEHIFYEWMIESAWAINKNRVNLMDCLVDVLQLAPGLQAICSWCKNGTASCFLMFAWHTSCYRCIKLICLTLHSILVISWYQNTKAPLPGDYFSVRLKCEIFSHINFSLEGVPKILYSVAFPRLSDQNVL